MDFYIQFSFFYFNSSTLKENFVINVLVDTLDCQNQILKDVRSAIAPAWETLVKVAILWQTR